MSKREYRRYTAEQKLQILRESEQPGVTVSEVELTRFRGQFSVLVL